METLDVEDFDWDEEDEEEEDKVGYNDSDEGDQF